MSDSIDFEHEYETEEGDVVALFVSMEFSSHTDHEYGADADGNRGRPSTFMEPKDIVVELENGIDITDSIYKYNPSLYKELKEKAEKLAEDQMNDPDYGMYDNYN